MPAKDVQGGRGDKTKFGWLWKEGDPKFQFFCGRQEYLIIRLIVKNTVAIF